MKKISLRAILLGSVLLAGCATTLNQGANPTPLAEQKFSTCVPERLADVPIMSIDTLVTNCTEKKEEGPFIDGLGGVYPEYDIINNTIVMAAFDNEVPDSVVACQESNGAKYISLDATGDQ